MIELLVERPDRAPSVVRPGRFVYRLAGRSVATTAPLPELEAFRSAGTVAEPPGDSVAPAGSGTETLVYAGPAWIGGRQRTVECRRTEEGLRIDIDGLGCVEVASDGRRAALVAAGPALASDTGAALRSEVLLGPALILALAARRTLCVHASAVAVPSDAGGCRLVAFLGASGAGKSTLARLLDGARPGWRRAADDILPLGWPGWPDWKKGPDRAADAVPTAYPWFPQLKLDTAAQPGARLPEALPLAALFVLASGRGTPATTPVTRSLTRAEAALALVRHTASARLFDRSLLEWHLELCSALAERLPVIELTYPWRGGLVPGLVETVAAGPEAA